MTPEDRKQRIAEIEELLDHRYITERDCADYRVLVPSMLEQLRLSDARVAELEAALGEDKLQLFYRLKNEQAKSINRETAGCRACNDRAITAEAALARLLLALGCQIAGVGGALLVIEAKNATIADLEAALRNAPHARDCPAYFFDVVMKCEIPGTCNCWKSALKGTA